MSGSVSITVNRHEELSDRSAPYADFGHGSLFEAAPGAAGFIATTESPTKFLFKPFKLCMEDGGLHAYFNLGVKRVQAQRPRASIKPPALDRDPHGVI